MTVKPLAGNMDSGLAPGGCLDPKLERFKKSTCVVCDEIVRDLACQATDGFPSGDRPKETRLAPQPAGFTISGMSPSNGEYSPSLEVVTFFQRGGWIVRRVQVFGLG